MKVVAGQVVVAVITAAIVDIMQRYGIWHATQLTLQTLFLVLPLLVLVINLIVVCEVRRASSRAANDLGQQTTSSNSVVPTVTLVTTSFVYVVLCSTSSIADVIHETIRKIDYGYYFSTLSSIADIGWYLRPLIFIYNFFVYLITARQFRSELRSICCRCRSNSAPAAAAAAAAGNVQNADTAGVPQRGQHIARVV